MMRCILSFSALMALASCDVPTTSSAPQTAPVPVERVTRTGSPQSVADFRVVVRRVEPVAEQVCRQMRPGVNCDFSISIDNRPNQPPNAFQTYSDTGRPLLVMTPALLRRMRNRDEIAFVVAHEAAHHIEAHIGQTQRTAATGAILGAVLGAAIGLDATGVDTATNIGGNIGARRFSKGFELEADALGARIAQRSGYNPLRGVLYFQDARDPGDQFLGTHPPNADRIQNVRNSVR